jgi:prepilin-type N-terminal cleavage/methylation domain-containing protein
LRIKAKNAARPWGFTLIELLTVVAIIAVLATLLSSALSTARRKARQSVSIGNLRQIALAFNMYQDDQRKRPTTFAAMVQEKLITEKSLICAEDKLTANWAGLIEDAASFNGNGNKSAFIGTAPESPTPVEVPHSYFKAFDSSDDTWEQIEKNPLAGIAACQLHGIGRQSVDVAPSLQAYQGLVLRALKDTSVVSRQVFWQQNANADNAGFAPRLVATPISDLPLFLDPNQ